ncbi:MAG: hypothetical protein M3O35_10825 [Acidobacteriota bacterium]|nr:hypothetical protein [Acidobacteriota bacterium]
MASAQDAPKKDVDDNAAARDEWFYSQREYPLGHIPAGARVKAIEAIKNIESAARARTGSSSAQPLATSDSNNWSLIGPRPTGGGTGLVTAGRVNAIAIDPRDNNVVYIGAAEGGVWKTTDGGQNWIPLTDDQPSLANGSIAIDPNSPDVVYVGTGEENFTGDSYYGAGILKSTDGGQHWTSIVGPFLRATIGSLAVHPVNGQVILAAVGTIGTLTPSTLTRGVWRSADGGLTWTQVLTGAPATSVLFDPSNGNTAYAALGNINGAGSNGVYKSSDAGKTWTQISGSGANALPSANIGRVDIGISPSNPSTLFVAIQDSSSSTFGSLLGVFKTTDGGSTWNKLTTPNVCSGVGQCWYDMNIRVSPKDPNLVFLVGSLRVARSMDGGATWATVPLTGPNGVQMHVDEHFLAFTPDGSKLFVANDGGVYSTVDAANPTVRWVTLNNTLAITQFYPGLAQHPTDPSVVIGGAQDNGTQLYFGNMSWTNVTCGDGGFAAIDNAVPNTSYGVCQNIDIRRSTDAAGNYLGSVHGIDQTDRTQFISPFALDPSNSQTLYFGTYRVWQSRDGAGKWTPISPDLSSTGRSTIKAIAVAPSDPNTVYVGTSDSQVQVTRNAGAGTGASWVNRTTQALPARTVTAITVDPIDPATAYVTFSGFSSDSLGHLFRTHDAGSSWTDVTGNLPNLPVNDVVVDPDIPNRLYVATDAGVMFSTDAGATWNTLGNQLPRVVVLSLGLQRSARVLRAATHGRSVWEIAVPLSSASVGPVLKSISPNQANAGDASLAVTATGSNFASGMRVRWNGQDRPTTFSDAQHLTVQILAADLASVGRASVSVFNPNSGGGSSNPAVFSIGPAPSAPPNGFVNDAFPLGGNALAERSIASLYGVNFAPGVVIADGLPPLPFTLGGLSMTMGDSVTGLNPVPLFFVSPGQVNFQVPRFGVTVPTPIKLTLTQGAFTSSLTVTLRPFSPGIFTTNQGGSGQASALINGTASVVAPVGTFPGSRPIKRGEYIQLYATGLGDVTNRPSLGSPSPSNPLAFTVQTPVITLANVPIVPSDIPFSGLAPGFVGLYQINFKIPDTAPSGNAVPISLTIGGVASNTATIAIE